MRAHLYLRASTNHQDATRAEALLKSFAAEKGLEIVGQYVENASGTKLDRPELTRMLGAAQNGDVVVVESVDRLSRLSQEDWTKLKRQIEDQCLRLVVVDLPTSHEVISDGITGSILRVINSMLIDLMATMARLDQEKRVERIAQGLAKKRANEPDWKPSGRKVDVELHSKVKGYLAKGGLTKDEIAKLCGCGVATVYRIAKS